MERLSREFLEKLATNKELSTQQVQESIEQELKRLADDIVKRTVK